MANDERALIMYEGLTQNEAKRYFEGGITEAIRVFELANSGLIVRRIDIERDTHTRGTNALVSASIEVE